MNYVPFVSICLPVRNERDFIEKTIACIEAQTYPSEKLECIVVDGCSTDGTREYIERALPALQLRWVLLDNPNHIVPTAMNIAVRQASGDVIIRVDGHTLISPTYVDECVNILISENADNVGGCMNAISKQYVGQCIAFATSSRFGIGNALFHFSQSNAWVDTVYMGAWRREVFHRIGLFDEELVRNQDDEFNYRLRADGGNILLAPSIKSKYYSRSTLLSLFKQYFQYGYWKVRVLQKHPRQMQWRQFVPVAFVSAVLGTAALFAYAVSWPFIFVASAYLCANIAASVIVAARRGIRYLPLLPVVFATLHISYGAGFLVGLFRFIHRWGDRKGKVPEWDGSVGRSVGGSE